MLSFIYQKSLISENITAEQLTEWMFASCGYRNGTFAPRWPVFCSHRTDQRFDSPLFPRFMKYSFRFLRLVLLIPFLLFSSCDVLQSVLGDLNTGGLSSVEIVRGLKAALKQGAKFAGDNASQENGYLNNPIVDIRIPLPDKLQGVEKNIRRIPLVGDKVVDNFITAMNRGAEEAAKKAAPIFVDAITSMTVTDGLGILKGERRRGDQLPGTHHHRQPDQRFQTDHQKRAGSNQSHRLLQCPEKCHQHLQ